MCGIVGYIGYREARKVLLRSLRRLEYRGYDSAGLAVASNGLIVHKTEGQIDKLVSITPPIKGTMGVAHTRWATHGKPSTANAHPHTDCEKRIALVHNGIIENYQELKERLIKKGHKFSSETDTECLVHLVEEYYNGDLERAVRTALKEIKGTYAIVVMHENEERLVAARKENPLIIGMGKGENFVASDIPALLEYTNEVLSLYDNEIAIVDREHIRITNLEGAEVKREAYTVEWTLEDAEKGGYEHFMLKEIFEQPDAIHQSLLGRLSELEINGINHVDFGAIKIVACGTSYHAGLVGKYILEDIVKVPTWVEMASEYRYSSPSYERPLVVLITQSGETADTVAAAREARFRGCRTVAITNVVGSSITREVDHVIYTRAGVEIGVAATKTFTTQLVALYLLAFRLGLIRRTISPQKVEELKMVLRGMPRVVQNTLDNAENIKKLVPMLAERKSIFFIGRNINYPSALEGALKLKEISYIHAEGYPAGELKHGPLALLTAETPVIAIAVKDHTYEKLLGNIGEVKARGAPVIAVGFRSDRNLQKYADEVIYVSDVPPLFTPIPVVVSLQLLAYYVAKARGCSIDKPRNLAKSVTVE